MENKKFESLLVLIVPRVVHLIAEKYNLSEVEASKVFYESKVYETLEQEETKLWQLSPLALFDLYDEEKRTGIIIYPEG